MPRPTATRYPDPHRFDISRDNARTHLAFGKSIHMRRQDAEPQGDGAGLYLAAAPPDGFRGGRRLGAELAAEHAAARTDEFADHLPSACMNFDLDGDQQLFRASVERFAGGVDIAARDRMRAE
jgi:hypothetical protein